MSSLTYSGFFCEFFSASLFRLGILWDENQIKIFCLEIWVKMIFGWPTFKIMRNTPIFYQLSMSNWKPGERLQAPGSLQF